MFSIDIILNIADGTLACEGALWKKALTFASVTSARRPDLTGHGMRSGVISCLLSAQKEEPVSKVTGSGTLEKVDLEDCAPLKTVHPFT